MEINDNKGGKSRYRRILFKTVSIMIIIEMIIITNIMIFNVSQKYFYDNTTCSWYDYSIKATLTITAPNCGSETD